MRRFAGVELGEDDIPDESTILRFRHLLEEHGLTQAIFAEAGCLLEEKRLILKSGTIVDATMISLDAAHVCLSVPSPLVCRSSNERFMHAPWTR